MHRTKRYRSEIVSQYLFSSYFLNQIAKKKSTYEKTNSSALGSGLGIGDQASEREDHRQALSESSPEEQLATTNALNDEPRSCSEDGVNNHVYTTHKKSQMMVTGRDVLLKQNGWRKSC